MQNMTGVWIDRREAVVVTLTPSGEDVERIDSDLSGALEPHRGVPGDGGRQRSLDKHLAAYYDRVIDHLRGVELLLILGAGEAKHAFADRVVHRLPGVRVVAIEAADRVTGPQLIHLVRSRFREFLEAPAS